MAIPLYDDFDNAVGAFPNYDTYDTGQRAQLANQQHVDLRSFTPASASAAYAMFTLDTDQIGPLESLSMGALESGNLLLAGEGWTAGTVGPLSSYNNFNGLSLACAPGLTTTSSTMAPISIAPFAINDFISLALPNFPIASLTLTQSFLDLTSNPNGDFTAGPTDSLPLSSSTTTLNDSDCEARFPLSLLLNVDQSAITGVRFRITATANCTFQCLAVRCLSAAWEYAPVDQNTLYGRLQATVPPSASLSQPYTFPMAAAPVAPSDWPVMFWSDGEQGPQAVDVEVGAMIQTGSNTALNTFTLYFRELAMIPRVVGSLDGLELASVEGFGSQLDYTPGTFDTFSESRYLTTSLQWGTSCAAHIKDQAGTGYDFSGFTLSANSSYYLLVQLEDNSLRMRVFNATATGVIDWTTAVFDSTAVIDSTFVPRRRGRLGWYAQLNEGDTYITALRPRRVVFGEYRSAPLGSLTPVDGARLYASTSPDLQLYSGALPTTGALLTPDVTKSRSGHCFRVSCDGLHPLEGFYTSPIRFESLADTVIEFDVLAPTSGTFTALLTGEGRSFPLYLPPFPVNQWAHVTIPLTQVSDTIMPGLYSLYFVQGAAVPSTWYIDNPSVRVRAVAWSGRGRAGDPLKVVNPAWISFGDSINDPDNAALLGRGRTLQVRGQAVIQGAEITGVTILPKYAELGHFIWADQAPTYPAAPSASFTISISSMTVSCNATASTGTSLIAYAWNFGDGVMGYGATPSHTYAAHGTYTITLTVIDATNQKSATTHTVTV